jgi:hypothetical protein
MSEPVAWRIAGRFGWFYQDDPPYESQRGRIAEPLYQHPQADHREVMRQALEALSKFHRSTGWGDDCLRAVNALRAALGERDE